MMVEAPNTSQRRMCVVTVCVDQGSAAKVRQAALRADGNFVAELQHYSPREVELQPLLKFRNAEDSYCIIDFDRDHEAAVVTANAILQMQQGQVTVIALSEKDEPALILEAMRAGCSEYLIKPLSIEAVCESLTRLRGRLTSSALAQKAGGKVLALLGCRGGAGTTTLAVHLAVFLSRLFGRKVLIVDQHRQLGHVGLYLGLDGASYDFYELVRNVERLDRTLLDSFVTHHSSGLDMLPSPSVFNALPSMSPDAIERTVHFLAGLYEYVVVDLPAGLDDANRVTIDCCEELYVIATPDVPALRDLSRYIDRLLQCSVSPAKLKVVINRFCSKGAVSLEEIQTVIRQPISITIPNHSVALICAMNTGTPIAPEQSSEFTRQIKKWAGGLAPAGEAVQEKPRGKLSLWHQRMAEMLVRCGGPCG
jgi:pilus assembly protein CpaE